jgi:hypothetical protein
MRMILLSSCLMMFWEQFPELGGRDAFKEFHATSGPSITGSLWCSGMGASALHSTIIQTHFLDHLELARESTARNGQKSQWVWLSELLEQARNGRDVVIDHYRRLHRFRGMRPVRGLYKTQKFAKFIDDHVPHDANGEPTWPKGFVCFAGYEDQETRKEYQVIFTEDAIYLRGQDGVLEKVADEPARIGLAVAASCAIPMIFEKVCILLPDGRVLECFDGGMSWEGPIPLQAAAAVSRTVADLQLIVDVGEETGLKPWAQTFLFRSICGGRCVPFWTKIGEILGILPLQHRRSYWQFSGTRIGATQFGADADTKWIGTAEYYSHIARAAEMSGLPLKPQSVRIARAMAEELDAILANDDSLNLSEQAWLCESVFVKYGAYRPPSGSRESLTGEHTRLPNLLRFRIDNSP